MKFRATLMLLLGLGSLVLAHDHDRVDSNYLRTETKPEGRNCVDYKDPNCKCVDYQKKFEHWKGKDGKDCAW